MWNKICGVFPNWEKCEKYLPRKRMKNWGTHLILRLLKINHVK